MDAAEAGLRFSLVDADLATAPDACSVTAGLVELRVDDTVQSLLARADAALYSQRGDWIPACEVTARLERGARP